MTRIRNARDPRDELNVLLMTHRPDEVLNEFTENGGASENEEFEVRSIDLFDEGAIRAECTLSFDEMIYGGCGDMLNPEGRFGYFSVEVDPEGNVDYSFDQPW